LAAISQVAEDVPPVFLIPTGMIGLISMICTRRMQRLGDLAAGTMVIVDERSWRLPVAKVDDPRVPALASFVPGDYRVSRSMARTLAVYAERRHYLTPARRREVARHLTIPLVERFEFRRDIDPDLLMYALYYKTFLSDASAGLADLGPLAGYSPLLRDADRPQGIAGNPAEGPRLTTAVEEVTPIVQSESISPRGGVVQAAIVEGHSPELSTQPGPPGVEVSPTKSVTPPEPPGTAS
jgi:hypothetical protein